MKALDLELVIGALLAVQELPENSTLRGAIRKLGEDSLRIVEETPDFLKDIVLDDEEEKKPPESKDVFGKRFDIPAFLRKDN